MIELLHEAITKAKDAVVSFQGWTFFEVAAAIKLTTQTEHTVKDMAEELSAMAAMGEIEFA